MTFTFTLPYEFIQVDTRPGSCEAMGKLFDESIVYGIEITFPAYAAKCIKNLDHHGASDTTDTPSAIEQAVTAIPPLEGMVLATVRPDADSIGAMAIFVLRSNRIAYDKRLVSAIGAIDRHGPQQARRWSKWELVTAITRKSADAKIPLNERVAWVAGVLSGNYQEAEIAELVSAHDAEFVAAASASKINLCCDGRIVVIESSNRFATELGYQYAQTVVAFNAKMPVDFSAPSSGTYKKFTICRYSEFVPVDMQALKEDLNALEAERTNDGLTWGGQANIIGSPQGRDSSLTIEEVVDIVSRHLI